MPLEPLSALLKLVKRSRKILCRIRWLPYFPRLCRGLLPLGPIKISSRWSLCKYRALLETWQMWKILMGCSWTVRSSLSFAISLETCASRDTRSWSWMCLDFYQRWASISTALNKWWQPKTQKFFWEPCNITRRTLQSWFVLPLFLEI